MADLNQDCSFLFFEELKTAKTLPLDKLQVYLDETGFDFVEAELIAEARLEGKYIG